MTTTDNKEISEVVAVFEHDGTTYEIDHLGIGYPETQWGEFAIYAEGAMVGDFAIAESIHKPKYRPAELPITTDELIALAIHALDEHAR